MALEWIDGYYIRSSSKEVYEKHEFEFGELFSATINGTSYTDLYYPFGYYVGGSYWYYFSHGRHRVTYPPDETAYYFDRNSYSNQINDKIGDRYKIQFQNLVIFNDVTESIKYSRQLDYDASKIIRGTPIAPPTPTYEWETVASISGNNETHALAQVNSESINNGEPISNLASSDFIALPDAIKVKALADARVRE